MTFPLLDESTAPEAALEALKIAKTNFGMIPNVEKVMALTPQLLSGYTYLWDLFDTTTLTPIERQVVYLTANFENECNYCVPWHTILAKNVGIEQDDIEALRSGAPLTDKKLDTLRTFTRTLIANRGKVSIAELQTFYDAGYTDIQVLEVILGLAIKTISNYTNSVAGTPLDQEAEHLRWEKPLVQERVLT
ncbi:MAG: carboxymuconolactone decarboxylase family protein [Gammaproteobacteria bacterium]|nr:carboxymuconolactone decarboxylase family protein [Gammaproteobacteria bacterium]